MPACHFVSDLHGKPGRYRALFEVIREEAPAAVFLGGDLFPHELARSRSLPGGARGFLDGFLAPGFAELREEMGRSFPRVFVILGNDDARTHEAAILRYATEGLWQYVHRRRIAFGEWAVCGYACIPPSPFQLKDWERYDVSRFVDPGCIHPAEGRLTIPVPERQLRWQTIADDLQKLSAAGPLDRALCMFHCPPYQTNIDRADLDEKTVDHAPLDVHIGSIAIRRFFEEHSPRLGLHGHVHESARLTGSWRDRVGQVPVFSAAHDGPELSLVRFDPEDPDSATRSLLAPVAD